MRPKFLALAHVLVGKPLSLRHQVRGRTFAAPARKRSARSLWVALAITAENFTSAIGTVIFVAYLSALCQNPLHTATQYALLTALAAVGRTYLSSGAGYVAKATGWPLFFAICVVVAVPGLMLLAYLQRREHFDALEPAKV